MGSVTPIRQSAEKSLARANAYIETAFKIIALSRRRRLNPVQGKTVLVMFDTEAEAKEFQNLLHSLPSMKRRT